MLYGRGTDNPLRIFYAAGSDVLFALRPLRRRTCQHRCKSHFLLYRVFPPMSRRLCKKGREAAFFGGMPRRGGFRAPKPSGCCASCGENEELGIGFFHVCPHRGAGCAGFLVFYMGALRWDGRNARFFIENRFRIFARFRRLLIFRA